VSSRRTLERPSRTAIVGYDSEHGGVHALRAECLLDRSWSVGTFADEEDRRAEASLLQPRDPAGEVHHALDGWPSNQCQQVCGRRQLENRRIAYQLATIDQHVAVEASHDGRQSSPERSERERLLRHLDPQERRDPSWEALRVCPQLLRCKPMPRRGSQRHQSWIRWEEESGCQVSAVRIALDHERRARPCSRQSQHSRRHSWRALG
jgi:hypothetical protein